MALLEKSISDNNKLEMMLNKLSETKVFSSANLK